MNSGNSNGAEDAATRDRERQVADDPAEFLRDAASRISETDSLMEDL